ncbi:hypothetical protein [Streptomyces sp. NBC_01217]|uniref:hypothetical protein n=1 Tax=Streptomyces sp. NBC_01217 TaxID=2903779 RepID=UPI002E0FACC3|nr:hypothetical protein OG507_01120 [Streptomyces sp. NBC_01217]
MAFADDHLTPLVDAELGNSACLVGVGDGRALARDASRDLCALRENRPTLSVALAADIRQTAEHIPGATHGVLGDLAARIDEAPTGAAITCGHGERAMTAAGRPPEATA